MQIPEDTEHVRNYLQDVGSQASSAIGTLVVRLDRKVEAGENPTLYQLMQAAQDQDAFRLVKDDRPLHLFPQLLVFPETVTLAPNDRQDVFVSMHLPTDELFNGSLCIDPDNPATPVYSVPVLARPVHAVLSINDNSILDFGRCAFGHGTSIDSPATCSCPRSCVCMCVCVYVCMCVHV